MNSPLETVFKTYMNENIFDGYNNLKQSSFGSNSAQNWAIFLSLYLFVIILGFVLGFLAVQNICKGKSDGSRNIRLGLYALLLFTGGKIGWLYVLLWIFRINVCI